MKRRNSSASFRARPADDLIGSQTTIDAALATGSDAGAFTTFFDAGVADLSAYFDLPSL
jgi:hypothetical protein